MSASLMKNTDKAPHTFTVLSDKTKIFEGAKEVTFFDGNLETVGREITFSYIPSGSSEKKVKDVSIESDDGKNCLTDSGCFLTAMEKKKGGRRKRKTKKTRRNRRRSSRRRN